jgi:hypothetical protein
MTTTGTARMLMAAGVEGRVPLLDHRLVAFRPSLPDGLKVNGRTGKGLLQFAIWHRLFIDSAATPTGREEDVLAWIADDA